MLVPDFYFVCLFLLFYLFCWFLILFNDCFGCVLVVLCVVGCLDLLIFGGVWILGWFGIYVFAGLCWCYDLVCSIV